MLHLTSLALILLVTPDDVSVAPLVLTCRVLSVHLQYYHVNSGQSLGTFPSATLTLTCQQSLGPRRRNWRRASIQLHIRGHQVLRVLLVLLFPKFICIISCQSSSSPWLLVRPSTSPSLTGGWTDRLRISAPLDLSELSWADR